ncbi:MAG TPA: polysaccharide biosynthesis tyrosine autokinase [Ohtaekwangia sp.]
MNAEPVRTRTEFKPVSSDGIDFNKLRVIIWNNILWVALIFIVVNAVAYLVVRYTKDLYESVSEIKLEITNDASELGINTFSVDNAQNADLISGEIEILRSRLFLSKILDSMTLDVGYFSKGEVLNHELFENTPYRVTFNPEQPVLYNIPIFLEESGADNFVLRWGDPVHEIKGRFNEEVRINDADIIVHKKTSRSIDDDLEFFFVIYSRDVALNNLASNLSVDPLNFSAKTIRISFRDNNPNKAQAIVQTISNVYLKYSYEQKNLANTQKIDWLNNELSQIEHRMEGFEDYFKKFTLENKTNDLNEDLRKIISAINRIDSQRYEFSRRVSELDKLIDGLKTNEFVLTPSVKQVLPEYIFRALDETQELLSEQEKIRLSHTETTFAYRDREQQINNRLKKLNTQLAELKMDWLKKFQELNQRKKSLEYEFVNMPDKSTEFSKNQRFYKLYEEFYLSLMQSKAGFEIAQAGSTLDFKILTPATFSLRPISPNRLMIAGVGLMVSMVINIFFIGFLYIMNDKITNLQELEKFSGVPVVGVIPSSRHTSKDSLHVLTHPKSMVSEAIRTIRTNLDFFRNEKTNKLIAISSTISGEGKSFVAMNLGGAMALSTKRVLLVDLDMRKVKINQPAVVEDSSKGMSTILIGKDRWQDCILKTDLETMDYIPSGPNPPNPSELLLRDIFPALLDELRKNYDYIILDTPPVGLVTDGIQAMRYADISIYIFRANYSKREFLLNLQRITSINKINNVTSLLNAMPSAGEKAYGYGYGYYDEGNERVGKIKSFFKV